MGASSALVIGLCLIACSPTTPPPAHPAPQAGGPTAGRSVDDLPEVRRDGLAASDDALVDRNPQPPASAPRFPGGSLGLNNTWADCVQEFVDSQKPSARERLIEALSVYFTSCDRVERRIVVEAPRSVPSGHDYGFESHVSFGGHLTRARSTVWLSVMYHGEPRIHAERIKLAADEFRWTSPQLDFAHDSSNPTWEYASIPYTRSLQPIVRKMIEAKDVIVRFEGARSHADVVVTDEMKQDLKLMMDALAAIKIP